ncbi:hypothetical protein RMR16_023240 [Agrobacterium sp. rho-13.3]
MRASSASSGVSSLLPFPPSDDDARSGTIFIPIHFDAGLFGKTVNSDRFSHAQGGCIRFIHMKRHRQVLDFSWRHRSEQYLTSCQCFIHFRRQTKERPHVTHVLVGNSPFFTIFGTTDCLFQVGAA